MNQAIQLSTLSNDEADRPHILIFSGHDKAALKRNIDTYSCLVDKVQLLDLAYTLANRRTWLPTRAYAVCRARSAAIDFLSAPQTATEKKQPATIAFAFTGIAASSQDRSKINANTFNQVKGLNGREWAQS